MARRRPDLGPDTSYWAWWLRQEAKAILLLAAVAAFILGVVAYYLHQAKQPREEFDAVVLRFGLSSSDEGNEPIVIVRTADGRVHQLHAHRSKLLGCTAGAPIKLVRQGRLIAVAHQGCRRAGPDHRSSEKPRDRPALARIQLSVLRADSIA